MAGPVVRRGRAGDAQPADALLTMGDREPALRGIGSMATRALLAELVPLWRERTGREASVESTGGIDAARRVREGEAFDLVVLAEDALAALAAERRVAPPAVAIARSPVAVAVRDGDPVPDVSTPASLRDAVRGASAIGLSTGPSGTEVGRLLAAWGIAGGHGPRTVVAPPGVPVARLLARGEVAIGFQQLPELLHEPGIRVLGPLPAETAIETTFAAAIGVRCAAPERARALIDFLARSTEADVARERLGMRRGA